MPMGAVLALTRFGMEMYDTDKNDTLVFLTNHLAEAMGTLGRGVHAGQLDDLVPPNLAAFGRGTALHDLVDRIVLEAGDEEHLLRCQPPEPSVVHVAAVHNHDRPGVKAQGAGDTHVVALALGDDHHAG